MPTPEDLEREHTLTTAVVRYNELRGRDAFAVTATELAEEGSAGVLAEVAPLTREESLELLALGEVLARNAGYGRQLGVRSARVAGASWAQIGAALGMTKQAAWEAHTRWIDEQAARHGAQGHEGFDAQDATAARALAGAVPEGEAEPAG
jgi:hypothetical protein